MNGGTGVDRVAALFDAVADLDPRAAAERLDEECAGDPALRQAVDRLLAHDRAAVSGFLAPLVAEARPQPPPIAPSTRLGRYLVLREVAEGGMGTVYVGYDEALDRRVALKVLHVAAGGARPWLLREGQALARLSHPNVVALHELDEHEGRVYLAMELVEGSTLRAWLAERPRSISDILRAFVQAGRGLAAAHQAGVVHRDFKPENVLVGADGRARVGDFGIAALASVEPDGVPALASRGGELATTHGALMGTPAYISPEQFEGERATPLSDQWSFAVSLYMAVYGRDPYEGETLADRAESVRGQPAVPPHRAELPAWLWPILERALERVPERRFPSMGALLEAIVRNVPRDPELDPSFVVRERQILSAVFVAAYLAHGLAFLVPATAQALTRPAGLVAVPAILMGLTAAVVAARWRLLAKNRYGERLAAVFLSAGAAFLGHRVLTVHMGFTPAQILVDDCAMLTLAYVVVALLDVRWVWILAGVSAATTLAGALRPADATVAVGVGCLACAFAMLVRLFLDRHVRPAAAVHPRARSEDAAETPDRAA